MRYCVCTFLFLC